MRPLAVQFLLESLVAPSLVAGLIMISARGFKESRAAAFLPALAILLALGTTYILAFGWPSNLALSARTKIMLSAVIGLAIGIMIERGVRGSGLALVAAAIGIPIWVGLPTLQQGRPETALLILPIATALLAPKLLGQTRSWGDTPKILIMMALAFGLAGIAAFGKSLSFAELSLALASALLAILAIGEKPLPAGTTISAGVILLTLITSLMLYSQASLPALLVLTTVIAADHLARLSSSKKSRPAPIRRILLYCLLPMVAAILIARIDGGAISIY